jgi:dTDP-4-amino-4,6-dideoxygalactose transaminase
MIQVPILKIPFDQQDMKLIHDGIDEITSSGMLNSGKWTREFEELFAAFADTRHCVSVNSGTAAIELILRARRVYGSSVIVPTNTFLATALAAIHAGNRVIFADSDPDTLSLDVADVERRIEPDTKAVLLVHIGGVISPAWKDLKQLCEDRGMYLIEDCAHAQGCEIDGISAGSLGIAGAFSFFPTKVMTTGEGGAIVTNDDEIATRARMIRNQGKNPDMGGRISELGHNFRMSEFTALMGVQQMRKAESVVAERRHIAEFYDRALVNIEGVRPVKPWGPSGYYKYVAYLADGIDRAAVKSTMKSEYNVSLTGEVYADLCHAEPVWDSYTYTGAPRNGHDDGYRQDGFPGAERIASSHICLPLYPGLSQEQLQHVVDSLAKTLARVG